MTSLAMRMLRHRPGTAVATLVALAAGVMILMAMSVLVESGIRQHLDPRPYPGAVVAQTEVTVIGEEFGERTSTTVRLTDGGGMLPEDLLVQVGGAFSGYVVLLVMFVVASTIGLSVRHRRRDLALLRAIAATPGQVRRLLIAEAALITGAASVVGVPAGLLATRWVHAELVARGFLPEGFPMADGVLSAVAAVFVTTLVAVAAAFIAARRASAIRPTEALFEAAVEPARTGRLRLVSGFVALAGAVSSSSFTVGADGQAAVAGAIGMLYLFVIAVALLAPWINRFAAGLQAPVLRGVWGPSGFLAGANLRANAGGMATVLTALVLSVGLGGSVWFLQDNLERQTVTEVRDGMLAQRVVSAPAGLPDAALDAIRRTPGVEAATAVARTAVVVRVFDGAEVVAAQAVDAETAGRTMDPHVREGDLAELRDGTVAVSELRASSQGWEVGDQVQLWLGDGTPATVRVAAIYGRGLGFGDLILSRDTGIDQVLVRTAPGADVDAALSELAARYPGTTVADTVTLPGRLAADLAVSAWLNKLLIGVLIGYTVLAAANTMVMATLARRREFALLRLAGASRRQVKRMVHAEQVGLLGVALLIGGAIATVTLIAVVRALTGQPVPYVPPLGGVAVVGGAVLLALTTTVLPIRGLLRTPPVRTPAGNE